MSTRLKDLRIGSLRRTDSDEPDEAHEEVAPTKEVPEPYEVTYLRDYPELRPYLTPDLIPDLVYMLQHEGIKYIASVDDSFVGLLKLYETSGWGAFLSAFAELLNATLDEAAEAIYSRSIPLLLEHAEQADPEHPTSILFTHPSQKIHADKEVIEYEKLRNDMEVEERQDIECPKCTSRRILIQVKQTRRADEAATAFALCASCKNRWIFSMA